MKYRYAPALRRRARPTHRSRTPPDRCSPPAREADASAGWRAEYRTQNVPLPDGGRRYVLPAIGSRVLDREADTDAPEPAIVVDTHPEVRAADHYIPELEATVADVNPEYDASAPVVEVAFAGALEAAGLDPDALDERAVREDLASALRKAEIGTYTYPADRLAPVDAEEADP